MKTQKESQQGKSWYKLDNSANIYPAIQRSFYSSVYRISAHMNEVVEPETLQKALDMTMPRFPTFDVCIKKGLFWQYFEKNKRPGPFVQEDIINPCMPIRFKSGNRYLIRVYYYNKKISVEFFHALTDGAGALVFLKSLLAVYLRLQGHHIPNTHGILDINEQPKSDELEDAYLRYANNKFKLGMLGEKAYRGTGTREPYHTLNVITGVINIKQLLVITKALKVTITEYIASILIYVLLEKQNSERKYGKRPVSLVIPINLRNIFPSNTLKNFILSANPAIDPRMGDYSFEEVLKQVHYYMRYNINEKFLQAKLNKNVSTQKNPFVRVAPLILKNLVVYLSYIRIGDMKATTTFTNPGIVEAPDEMKQHIDRFDVLLGQAFAARANCAVATFKDTMSISFSSNIKETDVEREFFRKLVKDGVHVKIETNRNNPSEIKKTNY